MSKITLATAVVALTVAVPLTMARAGGATQLVPAAYPPWGITTPTTTTETEVPTQTGTLATQPLQTSVEADTTSIQGIAPPQGTTTPIQAVSLRSGPSTSSSVIGTLRPGMAIQVLAGANYGWLQVETPVGSGWTYGSYLAPVSSTVVVQHPAPPQEIISR